MSNAILPFIPSIDESSSSSTYPAIKSITKSLSVTNISNKSLSVGSNLPPVTVVSNTTIPKEARRDGVLLFKFPSQTWSYTGGGSSGGGFRFVYLLTYYGFATGDYTEGRFFSTLMTKPASTSGSVSMPTMYGFWPIKLSLNDAAASRDTSDDVSLKIEIYLQQGTVDRDSLRTCKWTMSSTTPIYMTLLYPD